MTTANQTVTKLKNTDDVKEISLINPILDFDTLTQDLN